MFSTLARRAALVSLLSSTLFGVAAQADSTGAIRAIASIEPERYLIDRIGSGGLVRSESLLAVGADPHLYEPTPARLIEIAEADIIFMLGMEFEEILAKKIRAVNRSARLVDLRARILARIDKGSIDRLDRSNPAIADRHIWLDPLIAIEMSSIIADELALIDPPNGARYQARSRALNEEIARLDTYIRHKIQGAGAGRRSFFSFHQAFTLFANRYGLEEIALEREGIEPSARHVAQTLDKVKTARIKTIFTREGIDDRRAKALLEGAQIKPVRVDYLAYDYLAAMRDLADKIADSLEK